MGPLGFCCLLTIYALFGLIVRTPPRIPTGATPIRRWLIWLRETLWLMTGTGLMYLMACWRYGRVIGPGQVFGLIVEEFRFGVVSGALAVFILAGLLPAVTLLILERRLRSSRRTSLPDAGPRWADRTSPAAPSSPSESVQPAGDGIAENARTDR